jgi:signal transduction histidine kinase
MNLPRLLQNPVVFRMALLFVGALLAFLVAFVLILLLRRRLVGREKRDETRVSVDNAAFTIAAYDGVIRKLKEQEQELQALRRSDRDRATESASMSGAVLSNLGSGVLMFNNTITVRQANPAAKTLLGYASPFGLHARDIFRGVTSVRATDFSASGQQSAKSSVDWSQPGPDPLLAALASCSKEGISYRRLEAEYKTPEGKPRVLGITLSPVLGAAGESMGAAALISDLTEITRLSQQVRLRESMAALGEMSAGIAHEFKNSLATISGYAQMLQQSEGVQTTRDFAEKITAETGSLARIVNDFLNFARPTGFAQEPLPLLDMLRDCAAEARVDLQASNFPTDLKVLGDPTALRQAFSNLFRNSAEAVHAGDTAIVMVAAGTSAAGTTLTISDNGSGIPAEQLPRIFIPFFTTKAEGTGLGLALVHRIITEHGGTITVASSPSGTAFTLTFPPMDMSERHSPMPGDSG